MKTKKTLRRYAAATGTSGEGDVIDLCRRFREITGLAGGLEISIHKLLASCY